MPSPRRIAVSRPPIVKLQVLVLKSAKPIAKSKNIERTWIVKPRRLP
jgi:hypothetical protein